MDGGGDHIQKTRVSIQEKQNKDIQLRPHLAEPVEQ